MATELEYEKYGVPWLAALCYKYEEKETIVTKELKGLFTEKHIKALVEDRMNTAKKDMRTLNLVNQEEAKILQAIKEKVLSQMEHLSYLTPLLEEAEAIQAKKQANSL